MSAFAVPAFPHLQVNETCHLACCSLAFLQSLYVSLRAPSCGLFMIRNICTVLLE